jgi:sterol desaturase/sphingolipid hydroxylase (fatty acid hydroxylase superfamily)
MTGDFWINAFFTVGISFLVLCVVFIPLERAFPAKSGQAFLRPHWWTDLTFFLGQYLLWSGAVIWVLSKFSSFVSSYMPTGFHAAIAAQPWWLQLIEVVIISDLSVYLGHRLQHRFDFLWRFHSVHHSSQHLDWLAAHREHPLDTLYTLTVLNFAPIMMGFPISALAGLIAFRGMWAIYIHSNCRIPIGPLKYLVGAPQLHHWHHDQNRTAGNYANLSPMMDLLFGTFACPDAEPTAFGNEGESPKSYWRYMIDPLLPTKLVTSSTSQPTVNHFPPPEVIDSPSRS